MTEKQGGSDLRANTHPAPSPLGDGWYELTGHKWFCTHPVFDVFLTLAQAPGGITCFVAERPAPRLPPAAAEGQARRPLPGLERGRVRPPARPHPRRGGPRHRVHDRADRLDAAGHAARRRGDDAPAVAEAIWHARHRSRLRRAAGASSRRCATCSPTWRSSPRPRWPRRCAWRAPSTSDDRRARLPPPGAGGHEVLGLQARRADRGRGARVPGRQRLHRGGAAGRSSTATSRSAPSGRARATSSRSTCCARWRRNPEAVPALHGRVRGRARRRPRARRAPRRRAREP